jgi:hypothetical protein
MSKLLAIAVAIMGLQALGGCHTYYSEIHPTVESRQLTPAEDAYWIDRRWRQDKAEEWRVETRRAAQARMSREFYW